MVTGRRPRRVSFSCIGHAILGQACLRAQALRSRSSTTLIGDSELTPKAFDNLSPRVGTSLGRKKRKVTNAERVGERGGLANAFSVDMGGV